MHSLPVPACEDCKRALPPFSNYLTAIYAARALTAKPFFCISALPELTSRQVRLHPTPTSSMVAHSSHSGVPKQTMQRPYGESATWRNTSRARASKGDMGDRRGAECSGRTISKPSMNDTSLSRSRLPARLLAVLSTHVYVCMYTYVVLACLNCNQNRQKYRLFIHQKEKNKHQLAIC